MFRGINECMQHAASIGIPETKLCPMNNEHMVPRPPDRLIWHFKTFLSHILWHRTIDNLCTNLVPHSGPKSKKIELFSNYALVLSICVWILFVEMGFKHVRFIARTVLVKDNNIEQACGVLNRILGREDLLDQWRRTRYYEKPCQVRRRINYERCKAFYNEDMQRKIQMVLRKNRTDPFPGCNWNVANCIPAKTDCPLICRPKNK